MKNSATVQPLDFNNLPAKHNYLRIHKSLYGKPGVGRVLSPTAIVLGGLVYSYSAKSDSTCVRTYSKIEEDLCFSRSTICRGMNKLKAGYITSDKQSSYSFNPVERIEYNRSEELFYNEYFDVRGKVRRLKPSEIHVVSAIVTKCLNNKKKANTCTFSASELASELNFNIKSIKTAIKSLLYACIINRAAEEKGNSKSKKSTYHLNRKLYLHIRKSMRKYSETTAQTSGKVVVHKNATDVAADANAARERWLAENRAKAEELAERNKKYMLADSVYASAEKEIKRLGIAVAFAEIRNPADVPVLEQKLKLNEVVRAEALKRLGLTEQDLAPKYCCSMCSDTGGRPDGTLCDCYERRKKV